MKIHLLLVASTVFALQSNVRADDFTYRYPGNPNCPASTPSHSWRKYINNGYPWGQGGQGAAMFTVKLSKPVANLAINYCYLNLLNRDGEWWGTVPNGVVKTRGGDPQKFRMDLLGVIFTYDEHANVKYNGKIVGRLLCHIGNSC